jgi:hypothetical protein
MKATSLDGKWGGGDGREWQKEVAARPGSAGVRRGMELTGGAHMSMRREREGN